MHLPTIRQLQFLSALVRHQSFSKAAEACLVSQSTLSAGIKELEHILDVVIVDRSTRSFALTPIGEEITHRARDILARSEDLARLATDAAPLSGHLRLGVIPTISPFLLPQFLPALKAAYPDLQLNLVEDLTDHLLDQLQAGELDIALMAFPYAADMVEHEIIGRDKFYFACAPEHDFAQQETIQAGALTLNDVYLLEDGHCLRDHAISACQLRLPKKKRRDGKVTLSQDAQNLPELAGTSLYTLVQMVKAGIGATLLPEMAVKQNMAKDAGLTIIPYHGEGNAPQRLIGLAWRKGAGVAEDAKALGAVIKPFLPQ